MERPSPRKEAEPLTVAAGVKGSAAAQAADGRGDLIVKVDTQTNTEYDALGKSTGSPSSWPIDEQLSHGKAMDALAERENPI